MGARDSKQLPPGVARNNPDADIGTGKLKDPKAIEKTYPRQEPQEDISSPVLAPPIVADPSPLGRSGLITANPSSIKPVLRVRATGNEVVTTDVSRPAGEIEHPHATTTTTAGAKPVAISGKVDDPNVHSHADKHHPRTVVTLVDDEANPNDPGFKFGLQATTPDDKVLLVHIAKYKGWNAFDRGEAVFLGRDREELDAGSVLMETEKQLFQPLLKKCEESNRKCESISRIPRARRNSIGVGEEVLNICEARQADLLVMRAHTPTTMDSLKPKASPLSMLSVSEYIERHPPRNTNVVLVEPPVPSTPSSPTSTSGSSSSSGGDRGRGSSSASDSSSSATSSPSFSPRATPTASSGGMIGPGPGAMRAWMRGTEKDTGNQGVVKGVVESVSDEGFLSGALSRSAFSFSSPAAGAAVAGAAPAAAEKKSGADDGGSFVRDFGC